MCNHTFIGLHKYFDNTISLNNSHIDLPSTEIVTQIAGF